MTKTVKWQTESLGSDVTEKLGEQIGRNLRGGETIELISDLGGGKTTFVRGLARGFGSQDKVSSPSFTISKLYKAGNKELHHFDFYRLLEAGVVASELEELVGESDSIVVVEWADIVHGVLPAERLSVDFKTTDENTRQIAFRLPPALQYLIKGLV